MKILILGADGYLGWPTAIHFSNLGHNVFAVDNLSKRKIESEYGIEPINSVKFFQDRIKKMGISARYLSKKFDVNRNYLKIRDILTNI